MRFPNSPFPLFLGVLVAGCDAAAPTAPEASASDGPSAAVVAADSRCTVAIYAVLREAGSKAVVGEVQFRVDPPQPGSSDATVEYRGVYRPPPGLSFEALGVALLSRIPGQGPTWSDVDKSDPGTTLTSVLNFGGVAAMSQTMALALIDDPSGHKAVVNVIGATGGSEAEGIVGPRRDVPESLRERQRVCFGAG